MAREIKNMTITKSVADEMRGMVVDVRQEGDTLTLTFKSTLAARTFDRISNPRKPGILSHFKPQ